MGGGLKRTGNYRKIAEGGNGDSLLTINLWEKENNKGVKGFRGQIQLAWTRERVFMGLV